MFAYRGGFCKPLVTVLLLFTCLVALGCGSGDESTGSTATGPAEAEQPEPETAPDQPPATDGPSGIEPDVENADPEAVEVITGWVDTLSEGDTEGAAEYFAIPSVAENGATIEIRSAADAVLFNEVLPCGAELTSAETGAQSSTT